MLLNKRVVQGSVKNKERNAQDMIIVTKYDKKVAMERS